MTTRGYWNKFEQGRVSRRRFLSASATTGVGLAAAGLIGCGEEEAPGSGSAGTPVPSTATAPAGGSTPAASDIKRGGIFKTFTAADPPSIDLYTTPSFAARQFSAFTYSRLFRIDAQPDKNPFDQPPVGDLAESAESDDGATWVVKLRKGVKFQDIEPVNGRELTTEDVMFSWEKLTGPKSTLAGAVKNISGVEAVDDHTLRFTHDAPNADFLEQLADGFLFWVVPTESEGGFDPTVKAIGTGPWIMEKYDVSSRFVFKRNPDYFVPGVPYMDGVEQFIIPEYANQVAQFQGNNIHSVGPRADDVLMLRSQMPDTQWVSRVGTGMYGIFFSPEEVDPDAVWRDERFRIAASYAVDRDELLEFLYNIKALDEAGLDVSKEWNNQVAVGMGERWWLDPKSAAQGPSAKYFEYNPDESRKLLDAIGLPAGERLLFQYTDNRYGATWGSASQAVHGKLVEAGFPVDVETQDYTSKFITQTWQGRFSGLAFGNFGGFSSLSGYLGEQIGDTPENRRLLHSQDMLDLFAKQSATIDIEERAEVVHELQRVNAENVHRPDLGQRWHLVHLVPPGGQGREEHARPRRAHRATRLLLARHLGRISEECCPPAHPAHSGRRRTAAAFPREVRGARQCAKSNTPWKAPSPRSRSTARSA
jgi:peptide/nickel transport system substrate-binding protein